MRKSTAAALFGWFFVLGGAVLTSWALLTVVDARASANWPRADGVVLETGVERFVSRTTGSTRQYRYRANVTYRYELEGREYTSDRVSFLTDYYDSASEARETVNRYSKGSEVSVYYKPSDPAQAVLESNYGTFTYLPLGLSAFMFLVGALVVKGARRLAQSEQPRTPN